MAKALLVKLRFPFRPLIGLHRPISRSLRRGGYEKRTLPSQGLRRWLGTASAARVWPRIALRGIAGERGLTPAFGEQRAKRSQAREPHLETDFGDREVLRREQLLGPGDAKVRQVLMRGQLERGAETAKEMKPRKLCLPRDGRQVQRLSVCGVNEIPRAVKAPINDAVRC